ncbi:FHA domain-containing protein [Scytonema sp. UIC 10036]|uniref:FHA domain-containing protein n=1 Tax=Scytonema sp. UIC 10036 TaxID=2304196 RepID=UPI0012DAF0AA|nr:FHA domain-containing protein [Scytonema sp. UIC 10036]MUG97959.1 FHA domain-containing protein [Scytonema sp. UIC 10036]
MNSLTLQWQDAGKDRTQKIYEQQQSKNQGTVRIGRDPARCDIVLNHPTVSGLHIEIYFHSQQQCFLIRNLREQNPPLVDGRQLVEGTLRLNQGSTIYLGQQQLHVTAVSISSTSNVPETLLAPPKPQAVNSQPVTPAVGQGQYRPHQPTPPVRQQPVVQGHHHYSPTPPVQQGVYGLQCPKCYKVSSSEHLQVGCPWCGTSLAAAMSVLVPPGI